MKSLLDPNFRYTPAVATDIRKTFSRVREELALAECEQYAADHPNDCGCDGDGRHAHLPRNADECEFEDLEYQWHLREAWL